MTDSIKDLQREIAEWADRQFPNRDIRELLTKLKGELAELEGSGLLDPDEYADLVILILDMGYLAKVDISSAVLKKIEINRNRSWVQMPDGTHQHIEDEDAEVN